MGLRLLVTTFNPYCSVPLPQIFGGFQAAASALIKRSLSAKIHSMPKEAAIRIRRGTRNDSSQIVAIRKQIAAERVHSAIDVPWTVEEERKYINSLSHREAVHVATTEAG